MREATALRLAIDLLHVPSQVRYFRSDPLPEDLLLLLRIAAADADAEAEAARLTGRPRDVVRQAATFFIEQILLFPQADSYRVLGARPDTTSAELRRNMALLLRWLHPDKDQKGDRSVFATRVTRAWEDLKTSERRRAYDAARRVSSRAPNRRNETITSNQPSNVEARPQSRKGAMGTRTNFVQQLSPVQIGRHGLIYRTLWRLLGGFGR